jgi:hypothetical protein
MNASMRAVVLDAPGPPEALRIRELPVPEPPPGWVLIRVKGFGFNRSELHTRLGLAQDVTSRRVLGIEATGISASRPWPIRTAPLTLAPSLPPLGGADRRAHRAELGRLLPRVLERGARVGVDEVTLLDLDVAACDQPPRVLSLQESSGDSPGPEIDPVARVLGDVRVDDHVCDLEPAAGPQDAVDLREHGLLVGNEVDHAIRDHHVD